MAPRSTQFLSLSLPAKPSHLRQNYTPKAPLLPRIPKSSYHTPSTRRLQLEGQLYASSTSNYTNSSSLKYFSRTRDNRPCNPLSWLWRCHLCHTSYRFSATNRCLNDGHIFCSIPPPSSDPDSPLECLRMGQNAYLELDYERPKSEAPKRLDDRAFLQISTSSPREAGLNLEQQRKKRQKQKKHATCTAQFDYEGWESWNSWRRDVRAEELAHTRTRISSQAQCSNEDMDTKLHDHMNTDSEDFESTLSNFQESSSESEAGSKLQKNCFYDCDFPSECHHWSAASSRSSCEESPVTPSFQNSLSSVGHESGDEGRNTNREPKVGSENWRVRREDMLDRIYAEMAEDERYLEELFDFAGMEEDRAAEVDGGLGRLAKMS